ncbi:MAG: undecaprenyl-diphosphate phosphatase [Patescibacteria group bacterium]|nr:undecaprenyl-diphosphate phosphatase [Patescibacteria group bacterium]
MDITQAIILGIIQGVTEFLPISSSGHLVIVQNLMPNFSQPGILFDVTVHVGTLFAVIYFFRQRILSISKRDIFLLGLGTAPSILAGFFLQEFLENSFKASNFSIGMQFILTALMCFWVDHAKHDDKKVTATNSVLIGIAQAVSILPAISRSGATIFASRILGIEKSKAAEFSFLLSIPAILGASVLQLKSHVGSVPKSDIFAYFVGFFVAMVVGYFSISFTIKTLLSSKFKWFGFYTLILGMMLIFI